MQLVARHTAGGVFGEMLMAAGEASPVSVLSPEGAEVLFLPLERIMGGCERHCEGHARLRMNLLRESAQKFWQMRHRVTYLSEPSLRRRVLPVSYTHLGRAASLFFAVQGMMDTTKMRLGSTPIFSAK